MTREEMAALPFDVHLVLVRTATREKHLAHVRRREARRERLGVTGVVDADPYTMPVYATDTTDARGLIREARDIVNDVSAQVNHGRHLLVVAEGCVRSGESERAVTLQTMADNCFAAVRELTEQQVAALDMAARASRDQYMELRHLSSEWRVIAQDDRIGTTA